ncbi:MAG: hypothetical protein AB8G23_03095 [Myxococcota bacterium]
MSRTAALITLTLLAFATPSQAGTEVSREGRRIATGPKSVQQSIDGSDLRRIEQTEPVQARARDEAGRSLRAGPTLPVSVGIAGCPGCGSERVLDGVGPYIVIPRAD